MCVCVLQPTVKRVGEPWSTCVKADIEATFFHTTIDTNSVWIEGFVSSSLVVNIITWLKCRKPFCKCLSTVHTDFDYYMYVRTVHSYRTMDQYVIDIQPEAIQCTRKWEKKVKKLHFAAIAIKLQLESVGENPTLVISKRTGICKWRFAMDCRKTITDWVGLFKSQVWPQHLQRPHSKPKRENVVSISIGMNDIITGDEWIVILPIRECVDRNQTRQMWTVASRKRDETASQVKVEQCQRDRSTSHWWFGCFDKKMIPNFVWQTFASQLLSGT